MIENIDDEKNESLRECSFLKLSAKVVFNITLTQSFIPHSAIYYSLNAVAWYLSVCLFLYFCFPYVLHFFELSMNMKKAINFIFSICVLQILLCFTSTFVIIPFSDDFTKWFVYIFPAMRLIDFLIGTALGYIFIHRNKYQETNSNKAYFCLFLLLSIVLLFTPPSSSGITSMVAIKL